MNKFIFIINTLIFVACNEYSHFEINDCIQKPDSVIVWKINEIDDQTQEYTLSQNTDQREARLKKIKLKGHWSKTDCPID